MSPDNSAEHYGKDPGENRRSPANIPNAFSRFARRAVIDKAPSLLYICPLGLARLGPSSERSFLGGGHPNKNNLSQI
jgi:hypothetical protein